MDPRRGTVIVAFEGAVAIGMLSFLVVQAWSDATFDGRATSVLSPLLMVGATAALAAAVLTRSLMGRRWPGPVVALVWFAWWQVLSWWSLQQHAGPVPAPLAGSATLP